jgi:hypothetical protein
MSLLANLTLSNEPLLPLSVHPVLKPLQLTALCLDSMGRQMNHCLLVGSSGATVFCELAIASPLEFIRCSRNESSDHPMMSFCCYL